MVRQICAILEYQSLSESGFAAKTLQMLLPCVRNGPEQLGPEACEGV